MPTAKDGSKHHSFGRAKLHDDMEADKKAPAKAKPAEAEPKGKAAMGEHAEPDGDEAGKGTMDDEPDSEMPIEDHVAEHGPAEATEHMIGKDGMHHVRSHHQGQKHKSRHNTPEEAHAHMGKAMGMGMENPDAMGEGGAAMPEPAGAPSGGGSIPGLA